jgi:DNA-binding response OmpR family regulator
LVVSTILVVDDETDTLDLIGYNLRAAGFEVVTAANGEEGLYRARTCSPSLAVVDVLLPDIDGFELCRLMRLDPANHGLVILMLTALSSGFCRLVGLESGADYYLTKPFSPRELVSQINTLLRKVGPVASPPSTTSPV